MIPAYTFPYKAQLTLVKQCQTCTSSTDTYFSTADSAKDLTPIPNSLTAL